MDLIAKEFINLSLLSTLYKKGGNEKSYKNK